MYYNHVPPPMASFGKSNISLRVGFEPTREDPIGFQVQRLNHSAIAAATSAGPFAAGLNERIRLGHGTL